MKYFLDRHEVTAEELKKSIEEDTGETTKGHIRTINFIELIEVNEKGMYFRTNDFSYDLWTI